MVEVPLNKTLVTVDSTRAVTGVLCETVLVAAGSSTVRTGLMPTRVLVTGLFKAVLKYSTTTVVVAMFPDF